MLTFHVKEHIKVLFQSTSWLLMLKWCVGNLLDLDECATGMHGCHAQASCRNTAGSYSCKCNSGYYGNGTSCKGILNTILLASLFLLSPTKERGGESKIYIIHEMLGGVLL